MQRRLDMVPVLGVAQALVESPAASRISPAHGRVAEDEVALHDAEPLVIAHEGPARSVAAAEELPVDLEIRIRDEDVEVGARFMTSSPSALQAAAEGRRRRRRGWTMNSAVAARAPAFLAAASPAFSCHRYVTRSP